MIYQYAPEMGSILDDKTKFLNMGGVDLHDNTAKNEQKLQKRLLVSQNNVTAFSCCCKIL